MDNYDNLSNLLFLDIETVRGHASFGDLDERMQKLWVKKTRFFKEEMTEDEFYMDKAGIFAEFGKVVCISIGLFHLKGGDLHFRVKALINDDEKALLEEFKSIVTSKLDERTLQFVAHNGKEFDFPYLCRRMLINGIQLPYCLTFAGKKPWEIRHLDTMELWKFGDFKNFTSLDLLAATFGIPSPKDDIDGSQVSNVYYDDNDLERIGVYCNKDVVTTARVFLKLVGEQRELKEENVDYK